MSRAFFDLIERGGRLEEHIVPARAVLIDVELTRGRRRGRSHLPCKPFEQSHLLAGRGAIDAGQGWGVAGLGMEHRRPHAARAE